MCSVFWGEGWLGVRAFDRCMNVEARVCFVAGLGVSCWWACVGVLVSMRELVVVDGRPVGVGGVGVAAVVVLLVGCGIWELRCWSRGDRGG
jgi:hypothetical protein